MYKPMVDVGIYGNAYKVVEILITLPSIFVGSLIPVLNQSFMKKDEAVMGFIQKAIDLLAFIVFPIILFVIAFAPQIISILTREYVPESAMALRILSLAMIPWFIGSLLANVLLAYDRQHVLTRVELAMVVLNIGLNVLIIPLHSYYGAAWVTVGTEFVTLASTTYLLYRTLHTFPTIRSVIRSLICTLPVLTVLVLTAGRIDHELTMHTSRIVLVFGVVLSGICVGILYLIPHYLFGWFPQVLQERIVRLRGGHA
jgi:O-antigen/teichoic acid export membrane protein